MPRYADEDLRFFRRAQPAVGDSALHGETVGIEPAEERLVVALQESIENERQILKAPVVM